jgi:hypothetical protein
MEADAKTSIHSAFAARLVTAGLERLVRIRPLNGSALRPGIRRSIESLGEYRTAK